MNARDEFGRTSLHMAARDDATPDVITRLIKLGADLHAREGAGYSPLHYAASYNDNPDIIVRLVQCGSDLHAMNNYGWTPLHLTAGFNANPDVTTVEHKRGAFKSTGPATPDWRTDDVGLEPAKARRTRPATANLQDWLMARNTR